AVTVTRRTALTWQAPATCGGPGTSADGRAVRAVAAAVVVVVTDGGAVVDAAARHGEQRGLLVLVAADVVGPGQEDRCPAAVRPGRVHGDVVPGRVGADPGRHARPGARAGDARQRGARARGRAGRDGGDRGGGAEHPV